MFAVEIEIIGFVAGATNLFSSVPQLVKNLRTPALAQGQCMSRNAFQCSANAMWLVYGASVESASMTTFAALGCLMAGALLVQTYRAGARPDLADRTRSHLGAAHAA